jgi:hypothetical protein
MSDDRIERELREPGPRETAGRGRQLPADVRQARLLLTEIDRRRNAGRVVVRATAVGLAAAAAVAVAIAIGASPRPGIAPGASETPQPTPAATSTPAATPTGGEALLPCAEPRVMAVADRWGGAAGSRGTTIHITVAAGPDCVLVGHPAARILGGDGSVVITTQHADQPWVEPGDQPITMSATGTGTTVSVVWSNWCGPSPAGPQLTLELRITPDGEWLPVSAAPGDEAIPVPPCNGSGEPSTLSTYRYGG